METNTKIKNEQDLVKYVSEQLEKCKKEQYEQQAYLNISYFAGKQWIKIDRSTNRLVEPTCEPWEVRYTANKLQPIIRTELAKITKNKFAMYVNPATSDDSDIKAARVAEKVNDWLEYALDLQEKDRALCLWALLCGIAWKKPYWNTSKGIDLGNGAHQGDVDSCVVSIFELSFDTSYSKWEDVPWACHNKVRSIDYIEQVYGKKVKAEDGLVATNIYEAKLQNLSTNTTGVNYKKMENSAVVHEYWERPSKDYPYGCRITVASDTLLFYQEDIGHGSYDADGKYHPETDKSERELPFFPYMHIEVPGRLIPTCMAEQLIPVQREYNRSRSQIIMNKNLTANPILMVPVGSLVDGEEITNEPGQILYINPVGQSPTYLQPPTSGVDEYKNLEYLDSEFEFVSGQHETSHGQTPTGVTSGTAIGYLQEQDDTKLGPSIANFISCKQKYKRYMLKMIQAKYDVERTIYLAGDNKKVAAQIFKGADLTSIDVRVNETTMYQKSKAAMQDYAIKLVQYGMLVPASQHDKELVMKVLEFGIMDDVYAEYEQDSSQAQMENEKWQQGDLSPIVEDFYNHDAHIKEHNKFRKGEIYSQLPDNIKNEIAMHVELHKQFALKQLIASMPPPEQPQTPSTTETTTSNQGGIFMG